MDENKEKRNEDNEDHDIGDVLVEMLEVAINMILYIRNLYPEGIFKKCQKYNIKVMMSQHPDVNAYIRDVLSSIQSFLKEGKVEKIVLQISDSGKKPLEKFCFELKMLRRQGTECFLNLETHLRSLLLKLNTCEALLRPLPKDCSFEILVHTKQSSFSAMEEQADFLDFPWVRNEENTNEVSNDTIIIPVRSCSTEAFVLQCYVEERKTKEGQLKS